MKVSYFVIRNLLCLLLFTISSLVYGQQKYTISGYMTEKKSGEALIGAAVYDSLSAKGAVSNNYGYYTITLPRGEVKLGYSYIGYNESVKKFKLTKDTIINLAFNESAEYLSEAVVTASQLSNMGVRGTQMSAIEIPAQQIQKIPAMFGEVDLIKALQLLPGVQSGSEGGTGLYVRGGGPDENLLLLDGVPLYSVNHLFGFLSVFNTDAIKNVTLFKGSFPARFGSRLSSVVDVRMNDGNDKSYHGSVTVGAITSKINFEGPLIKEKMTFNLSFRRTYSDLLTRPLMAIISKREGGNDRISGGYHFYDFNAKVTYKFSNNDKIYLSYYMGDDILGMNIKMEDSRTFSDNYGSGTHSTINKNNMKWYWGNLLTALRWNHTFSPRLFLNASTSFTRFNHNLSTEMFMEMTTNQLTPPPPTTMVNKMEMGVSYRSGIDDIAGNLDFEYNPDDRNDIRFGVNYIYHTFRPGISAFNYKIELGTIKSKSDTTFGDANIYSNEMAFYAEDNFKVADFLKINGGLRYSLYAVKGKVYNSLEPRLSAVLIMNRDLSFKASYSMMSQYVHLLSNSSLSLPTDLWVPVTTRITPMKSHQMAAGLFYSWNVIDFSVEGYYKTMENVLEYRDGASFLGSTTGWEDKVYMGRGWSYGVEFLAQKKVGKLTGWVAYTWSKAMRQFDRPGNIINEGKPFHAKYDRRHDISITGSYVFSKKFDLSATFVYGTGTCGTLGKQTYYAPLPEHPYMYYGGADFFYTFTPVEYIDGRNNYRMPDYHRLDLGMNFYKQHKKGKSIWNLSVYNVYNNKNPFIVFQSEKTDASNVTYKVLKQASIFPILPSFSYTYQF